MVSPESTPISDLQFPVQKREYDQLFYLTVRDSLHAGKFLPFPESTFQTNALIYAVVDHNDFYQGNWPAAMADLATVTSIQAATEAKSKERQDCGNGNTYSSSQPKRRPRATDREIMRRRNRFENDHDGRPQLKIFRHRHESLSRLELQIDVLKEELERWPGKSTPPAQENEIRDWYSLNCRLQGVSKLEVIVPGIIVPSKGQLEILVGVLTDSAILWRNRHRRVDEENPQ